MFHHNIAWRESKMGWGTGGGRGEDVIMLWEDCYSKLLIYIEFSQLINGNKKLLQSLFVDSPKDGT